MLSNFYRQKISTLDGEFVSVEGYWYWLSIEGCDEKEELRDLSGYQAKKTGIELLKTFEKRFDDDFENKITRAIWGKVQQNVHMFKDPIATLPFEHYYNFGGNVVDVKEKYFWMVDVIDRMRNYIIKEKI